MALAGRLNVVACTSCGVDFAVDATMIYTDAKRGHWIYVARTPELPRWRELEADATALFERALASSPRARALARSRLRLVFGTGELQERLRIWDADLDDAVVECVKLRCLAERPDVRRPGERVRAQAFDAGAIELVAGTRSWRVPRAHVEDVATDPRWRAEMPELFTSAFVSIDRYL